MTKALFKLVISLTILVLIIWRLGGFDEIGHIMVRINLGLAGLVLLINTIDRALMTFKWSRLLAARGQQLPLIKGMKIYCASMIWGMFLPATVGADTLRAISTSRAGLDGHEVVASIVIERMVGFLSALLLGLISLILLLCLGFMDSRFIFVWWVAIAVVGSGGILFAASFSKTAFEIIHNHLLARFRDNHLVKKLRQVHTVYCSYQNNKGNLLHFSALTFGEQMLFILHLWVIALALGVEVSFIFVTVAVPLSMLVSRLPIGIYGLGTFEAAFITLMSIVGVSAAEAIAIAFSGRLLETVSWLPWWLAHVMPTRTIRPPTLVEEKSPSVG